jgi:uncharacterized protein (DUF1800 family)
VKRALATWRPARGEWNRAAAAHLHRRVGFGATPAELDQDLRGDAGDAVSRLLARDAHDPEIYAAARHLLAAGDVEQLAAWWMALILAGGAPLRERMTLTWHGHFATSNAKVGDVRMMHAQNELLRARGLGDFRELLHAIARDPAMLVWLDGDDNRRGAPNENFARELLELFALGRGAYAERDVQEAARAFTGWGTEGRAARFRPERHDDGAKAVLGRRDVESGADAVDAVLEHPACARHVARRLLRELVAPNPADAWVAETADVLVAAHWDVGATIETIVRSELFFSPRARRARVAAPVELVAGAARALAVEFAPQTAARAAADMRQALFRPPSVEGWDGGGSWADAGAWVARHNLLVSLAETCDAGAFADDPAARAVERLIPELVGTRFEAAVRGALPAGANAPRTAVALVLTAPEYHLA